MIKMLQYKMYTAGELRCPTTALVDFRLKPLFASVDMFKFKHERAYFQWAIIIEKHTNMVC